MNEHHYRHVLKGVNFSTLKHIIEHSPLMYHYLVHQQTEPKPPTPAMIFGSLVDCLCLEPETFTENFAVYDEEFRPDQAHQMTAKENKAWLEEQKVLAKELNLYLISEETRKKADTLVDAIHTQKTVEAQRVREYLFSIPGKNQQVLTWTDEETGIDCKGKVDKDLIEAKDLIIDLKTAADCSEDGFARNRRKYSLSSQAAMYLDGSGASEFKWVVVEKEPPYQMLIHDASQEVLDYGRAKYKQALKALKVGTETGIWNGLGWREPLPTGSVTQFLTAWERIEFETLLS